MAFTFACLLSPLVSKGSSKGSCGVHVYIGWPWLVECKIIVDVLEDLKMWRRTHHDTYVPLSHVVLFL